MYILTRSNVHMQVKFSDGITLSYNRDELVSMLDYFEHWYIIVSRGGRTMTRAKARDQIVAAHRKHCIKQKAEEAAAQPTSAAAAGSEIDLTVDSDDEEGQLRAAFIIKKMVKDDCLQYVKKKRSRYSRHSRGVTGTYCRTPLHRTDNCGFCRQKNAGKTQGNMVYQACP